MTDAVQVENTEPNVNGDESIPTETSAATTAATSTSELSANDAAICSEVSEQNLLKTLLSSSTATTSVASTSSASSSPSTTTVTVTSASSESMITKEVNDTQLNLTKILYEPDKGDAKEEKEQETSLSNGVSNGTADTQVVDDDDRLVIDISDDEKREAQKRKRLPKSMPLLGEANEAKMKLSKSSMWSSRHKSSVLKLRLTKSKSSTSSRKARKRSKTHTANSFISYFSFLSFCSRRFCH